MKVVGFAMSTKAFLARINQLKPKQTESLHLTWSVDLCKASICHISYGIKVKMNILFIKKKKKQLYNFQHVFNLMDLSIFDVIYPATFSLLLGNSAA